MEKSVIVSAVRTAIGKRGGALASLHPSIYGGKVLRETLNRANVKDEEVTDIILGNTLSNAGNIARLSGLEAGISIDVPGITIDRQCGSGISAVILADQAIRADGGIYLAGGTESMTQEPYLMERPHRPYNPTPPKFLERTLSTDAIGNPTMGITAENLAVKYKISHEEQNEFALQSQRKMARAMQENKFKNQILGIEVINHRGEQVIFDQDEHPRPDITLEQLNRLKPVFKEGGSVTAGSSSGINDGAAAVVMMRASEAKQRQLEPLGTVVSYATAGVDPNIMGIGPVPAIKAALKNANLTLADMDLIEINEAFAAQVLACDRELNFDMDKVNVNGGAIAHGHPIAATGTMLITKILYEMKTRNVRYGLVSACIGGGQGVAIILENNNGR